MGVERSSSCDACWRLRKEAHLGGEDLAWAMASRIAGEERIPFLMRPSFSGASTDVSWGFGVNMGLFPEFVSAQTNESFSGPGYAAVLAAMDSPFVP